MKIVIDIPDGSYEEICRARFPIQDGCRLVAWIKDGTPLPNGHGRIIDEDTIPGDSSWDWSDRLDATPTIIEADTREL